MNFLHRQLSNASHKKEKVKQTTYNGFTFREIQEFENAIIEVRALCRKKFEETNDMNYAMVALDCLKAIHDMEKLKSQISLK